MLCGRLQRKNSAHIHDVCTVPSCTHTSFDVALNLWIIGYFLFTCLLIIACITPYHIIAKVRTSEEDVVDISTQEVL